MLTGWWSQVSTRALDVTTTTTDRATETKIFRLNRVERNWRKASKWWWKGGGQQVPPLHTENYNGSRFLLELSVFAVPTGHHQQKYPETEEDKNCVTDRKTDTITALNHEWFSFVCSFSFSTAQPTESTLQGVPELMKKEKERKGRKGSPSCCCCCQLKQNRIETIRLWAAMNHALSGIGWSPIGFV